MRKIESFLERGYIKPSIQIGRSGQGSRRLWTKVDAVKVYVLWRCDRHGVSVRILREIAGLVDKTESPFLIIGTDGDVIPTNLTLDELRGTLEQAELTTIIPIEQLGGEAIELINQNSE